MLASSDCPLAVLVLLKQLIERNRQIANALARRVEDRVRDRRSGARDADLADAARAKRRVLVGDVGIDDFDRRYVEVDGNDIRRASG
jgi:hypothetical protein